MKIFYRENFTCKLGQNAIENWALLDEALGTDYFIHLSCFPSGYAILSGDDSEALSIAHSEALREVLIWAADICKNGTKFRTLKNIKVDYCLCKNVRKSSVTGEAIFISNRQVKHLYII